METGFEAMSVPPGVSVIVPARDEASVIEDCLNSLLDLSYPRPCHEIIVVDNGSTDDTRQRVRAYGDRVRLLIEERTGPAAARNRGVSEAAHGLVAFTDADCTVGPDWLSELLPPLEDPTVGIVGGTIRALHPENPVARFGERVHDHQQAIEGFEPPYAITMNWASPTALLRQHPFEEELLRGEDSDLSLRLWAAGYRLAFSPGAVVHHRHRDSFRSLMYEGYQHGLWAVAVRKKRAALYRELGVRRWYPSTYLSLLRDGQRSLMGPNRADSFLSLLFNLGKKAGKVAGSVRFGFLSL
jgi:cellulose synthase/poly-beta-1,6-N-acetylglucosamine synthase-like glycosyltransferase